MKRLLLSISIVLTSVLAHGQEKLLGILPVEDGKVIYAGVIHIEEVSKNELYNRARGWFVDTYNSGKDVIQIDDKERGEIVGKGYFDEHWMVTFYSGINTSIWQTIQLQFKDGRYKYRIKDFRIKYHVAATQYVSSSDVDIPLEDWNLSRTKNREKFYPLIDDHVNDLIESLKKSMTTSIIEEDW